MNSDNYALDYNKYLLPFLQYSLLESFMRALASAVLGQMLFLHTKTYFYLF